MTHKEKVKLAKKLIRPIEIKAHFPLFQSIGWEKRKLAIKLRIKHNERRQRIDATA